MKFQEFVFFGCKQKNNNNKFLQLDLFNAFINFKLNEFFKG